MKRFVRLCSLILLSGCEKDESIYACKGIPDINQDFSYLYFKTENEGYLFGTLTRYDQLSDTALADPNTVAHSIDEANIYKTTDGGRRWKKIAASLNYSYFDIATVAGDDIYILQDDRRKNFKFTIERFNLISGKVKTMIRTIPISSLWSNGRSLFFTNSRGAKKLYSFDLDGKGDSISIKDYAVHGLHLNGKSYAILSSREETYFANIDNGSEVPKMPILPAELTEVGPNTILIAGNPRNNTNRISLSLYDELAHRTKVIKEFKNYSIIKDLQSNGKAIVAFLGNIKGLFVEYDLAYSLDSGRSWQIKKLKERNYVHPSCLINNIVFIYSGGARMQKVVLD